ncbi:MAG: transporter substrate-binding domain-containing protein, partial [Micromonosporaceae bacterium]
SARSLFAAAGPGSARVLGMRYLRLAAVAIVVALLLAVGMVFFFYPFDPTEDSLRVDAGLAGKRELRIGVSGDHPGLSSRDEQTGEFHGFEIDIAQLIAADLGFRPTEVDFFPIETEKRHTMQARDGEDFTSVDLVVASFSITPRRERLDRVMFSAPYLRTTQSVVTSEDHDKVSSLSDLRDEPVCTLGTATSVRELREAGLDTEVKYENKISECVAGLLDGEYDAVHTDAAILAGWVAAYPKQLKQNDIGSDAEEKYGVSVGDNKALRTLVNLALYRSLRDPEDDRWEDAFDTHLSPLQEANWPQQVAEAEQPSVAEPSVRRMPWEHWRSDPWAGALTTSPARSTRSALSARSARSFSWFRAARLAHGVRTARLDRGKGGAA